jgi:YfiH family protein
VHTGSLGGGARFAFADRGDGESLPPYDLGNLADHVGDDPATVRRNRARVAAGLGIRPDHLVAMAPVHAADVAQVTSRDHASPPAVDVMVTTEPGCALLVLAADCVPVLLADADAGVAAVVHSGWRGVRADAAGAAVAAMRDLGADRITALVGPAVCGSCYPVDDERYAAVVERAPEAAATTGDGRRSLDLAAAVVARLAAAGVRVERLGRCTVEDPLAWVSYRRDGVTGRHGGAVVLATGG